MSVPWVDVALRIVLWLLAAYHLIMGAIALLAPGVAPTVIRSLYGASLADSEPLRYLTSMIGALALAIGGLAAVAALAPSANRPIIGALLALQVCRAFCRVRDRRLLALSLGVTARANTAAITVLGVESVVLLLGLR